MLQGSWLARAQDEKAAIMRAIGAKYRKDRQMPFALIMSTEAWGSEAAVKDKKLHPRNDPKRIEGIIIFAMGMRKNQAFSTFMQISRNGEKIVPGQWSDITGGDGSTRIPILLKFWQGFLYGHDNASRKAVSLYRRLYRDERN